MEQPQTQRYRVRVEDLRGGDPDRWLGPTTVPWSYTDDPAEAGTWSRPEAAALAADYRPGYAWRGRSASVEPVE